MTHDKLVQLRNAMRNAASGPWRVSDSHGQCVANQDGVIAEGSCEGVTLDRQNLEAICNMRNSFDELLDLAEFALAIRLKRESSR